MRLCRLCRENKKFGKIRHAYDFLPQNDFIDFTRSTRSLSIGFGGEAAAAAGVSVAGVSVVAGSAMAAGASDLATPSVGMAGAGGGAGEASVVTSAGRSTSFPFPSGVAGATTGAVVEVAVAGLVVTSSPLSDFAMLFFLFNSFEIPHQLDRRDAGFGFSSSLVLCASSDEGPATGDTAGVSSGFTGEAVLMDSLGGLIASRTSVVDLEPAGASVSEACLATAFRFLSPKDNFEMALFQLMDRVIDLSERREDGLIASASSLDVLVSGGVGGGVGSPSLRICEDADDGGADLSLFFDFPPGITEVSDLLREPSLFNASLDGWRVGRPDTIRRKDPLRLGLDLGSCELMDLPSSMMLPPRDGGGP